MDLLMKYLPHPRLYANAAELKRCGNTSGPAFLKRAARLVAKEAEEFKKSARFDFVLNTHNAHLVRARKNQTRVYTLLVRWLQTGDAAYRTAAVAHIREMGRWEYWSWITWRVRDSRPDIIFDLSYGENATTLAVAYDWLHATLTPSEKQMFLAVAKKWVFASFLKVPKKTHLDWWFQKPDTNWNTVCAGGAGMLALAMADDLPREAAATLKRAEASIAPYMKNLDKTQGGWPEGIGYWGYGMRYAYMYLLSWERATGCIHPLLKAPAANRTLEFPLDFMPNGAACSFGDVNAYWILPFHYAAALRYGRGDLVQALDRLLERNPKLALSEDEHWPNSAEMLIFHPRKQGRAPAVKRNLVRAFQGLDWYTLADRAPEPNLFLSIRGGTTEVPHGHMDLTSFHCVVGDEALITTISADEYLDTTFSPRRYELFEMQPPAKNVVLVNGIGIARPSRVDSKTLTVAGFPAVRIDATEAMSQRPAKGAKSPGTVRFYARLFVLLANTAH